MDFAFVPAVLAGFVVAAISLLELITTRYPRTYSLFVCNSWAIWAFSVIYGAIAFGVMFGWDSLVRDGVLQSSGFLAKSYWVRPILIGVCAKAWFLAIMCG